MELVYFLYLMFKRFLNANPLRVLEVDATRIAGVYENIAIILRGNTDGRMIEYVDHLHERFLEPAVVTRDHYRAPRLLGSRAEMRAESTETHSRSVGEGALRPVILKMCVNCGQYEIVNQANMATDQHFNGGTGGI